MSEQQSRQQPAPRQQPALRRFPTGVYGVGDEPDPRFTLANERTFLAWTRTALALIAGGVALIVLHIPVQPALKEIATIILLVGGTLAPLQAWFGWAQIERAVRLGRPLPHSRLAAPLAVLVAVVGLLLLVGYFIG